MAADLFSGNVDMVFLASLCHHIGQRFDFSSRPLDKGCPVFGLLDRLTCERFPGHCVVSGYQVDHVTGIPRILAGDKVGDNHSGNALSYLLDLVLCVAGNHAEETPEFVRPGKSAVQLIAENGVVPGIDVRAIVICLQDIRLFDNIHVNAFPVHKLQTVIIFPVTVRYIELANNVSPNLAAHVKTPEFCLIRPDRKDSSGKDLGNCIQERIISRFQNRLAHRDKFGSVYRRDSRYTGYLLCDTV